MSRAGARRRRPLQQRTWEEAFVMKSAHRHDRRRPHCRRGRLCVRLRRRAAEIGAQSLRRASDRLSDRHRGRETSARNCRTPPTAVSRSPCIRRCSSAAKRKRSNRRRSAPSPSRASPSARSARWSTTSTCSTCRYLFRNTEHMEKVIDGAIGQELLDKVTNSGRGSSACAGWMPARATSTTPRSRSRPSPTSRA